MVDSRKRVLFGTVRNPGVPVFPGMSRINKFGRGIFPAERRIVPFNSPPVPSFTVHEAETNKTKDQDHEPVITLMARQEF